MYAGLGIAPIIVAEAASLGMKLFSGLFGRGPEPGNEQTIMGWAGLVASNPTAASQLPAPYHAGDALQPAQAWNFLRCWAGDSTATVIYDQFDTVDPQGVCNGSDVAPEARTLIDQLRSLYPQLAGSYIPGNRVAVGTYGSGSGSSPGGGATIQAPLPGGASVNVPVPVSLVLQSSIAGIPILVWVAGGALLLFSAGRRGR